MTTVSGISRGMTLLIRVAVFLGVAISPYRADAQERLSPRGLFDTDQSQTPASQEPTSGPYSRLFAPEPIRNSNTKPIFAISQDPDQPPPQPRRTGLSTLVRTTGADFKAFPLRRSTWVILGIGAGAAALAHPADDSLNARMVGSPAVGRFFAPGKYIGAFYVQAGTAAGLYVIGRYVLPPAQGETKTNKVSHLGFDMIRALIVSQALTQGIKVTVRRDRPTGECCAFPSGHASATFATASVLERHLGYRAAWPTFVIAGYVAASRLHDNRHFISDVLFGSALGIASGWTVVGRHGRDDYALLPVPTRGGVAMMFTWTPGAQSHVLRNLGGEK